MRISIGALDRSVLRRDWRVRVYDTYDKVIAEWIVRDRTEREAQGESERDAFSTPHYADWTMMPI